MASVRTRRRMTFESKCVSRARLAEQRFQTFFAQQTFGMSSERIGLDRRRGALASWLVRANRSRNFFRPRTIRFREFALVRKFGGDPPWEGCVLLRIRTAKKLCCELASPKRKSSCGKFCIIGKVDPFAKNSLNHLHSPVCWLSLDSIAGDLKQHFLSSDLELWLCVRQCDRRQFFRC